MPCLKKSMSQYTIKKGEGKNNGPNPAGAPGRFARTEVKENNAAMGITNISEYILGCG